MVENCLEITVEGYTLYLTENIKRYLYIENGNCDLVYYQIIHVIKIFISKLSEQLCFAQIQDVKERKTGIEGVILLDETVTKQSSLLNK